MSKRCYVMLYKKYSKSDFSFIIPIKSNEIGSLYGGMPQFFGGGSLSNESNIETITRELKEEGLNYFYLYKYAKLDLIHSNTLERNNDEINFYFYITNDFFYKVNSTSFPIILSKGNEMSSIIELKLFCGKEEKLNSICNLLNVFPSVHFQQSETNKAFSCAFRKLFDQNL